MPEQINKLICSLQALFIRYGLYGCLSNAIVPPGVFFKCDVLGGFLNTKITIDQVPVALGREESEVLSKN